MTTPILPMPTAPAANASAEERQAFEDALRLCELSLHMAVHERELQAEITRAAQSKATGDLAQAYQVNAKALQGHAASNYVLANAFALPAAEPSAAAERRTLAIQLLTQMPVSVGDTDASRVKSATAQVEQLFALYPKAPAPAPIVQPAPVPVATPTPMPTNGGPTSTGV